MTFTRRTYRVAIRRSIRAERILRAQARKSTTLHQLWTSGLFEQTAQIAHTARLQRRKRRERK